MAVVDTALRDEALWKRVGLGLGAGRVAVGVVAWIAPVVSVRIVGLDRASGARADWLARMTAVRDLVVGAGALAATLRGAEPRERAAWLAAGAVADLGDAVAIRRGAREGRLPRLPAYGMVLGASGAALVGAVAASREAFVAARPPLPRRSAAYEPR